jgi:hypothetical protein
MAKQHQREREREREREDVDGRQRGRPTKQLVSDGRTK